MDDEDRLVRALHQRDRQAWDTMYGRHLGDLFGWIYHLSGGNRHLAEDIHQEVWLIAIERIEQFDSARGRFRDWIFGIARHRVLRHHRRSMNEAAKRTLDGQAIDQAEGFTARSPEVGSPEAQLKGKERSDMVRAALINLQEPNRWVLLAKYGEGLSVAEIAVRVGRTVKAVESMLSRAREQLRAMLLPYFSSPSEGQNHESAPAQSTGRR